MTMTRFVILAALICALGIAAALYFFMSELFTSTASPRLSAASAAFETSELHTVPPLQNEYRNDEFRFSLSMPEGFTMQEFQEEDSAAKSIVFQDTKGDGIQILVTPFPSDIRVLTADDVRADIPDMQVTNEQVVEIGDEYKGVAFLSDNDTFGGASREVWFVFRSNLYQISTYARLDSLLQAMFATWQFY